MVSFLLRRPPVRLCVEAAYFLSLWSAASGPRGDESKEKGVAFLATTELPARAVDLSALNLTELVNGMLSRALKDNKKFFSLLSITSYSSFAFHKFSVVIYNISNLKTVDPTKFPTRYCYCLSNRTNDLSDFTALLVDIIGNSTSYLTEIFKSTSILSVSQTNGSDCIFICVMTGQSGRNLSDFWDVAEKFPVINYTFTSSIPGALGTSTKGMAVTSKPTTTSHPRPPTTRPPVWGQSTRVSALRTSAWMKTSIPSEKEGFMSTGTPAATAGAAGSPAQPSGTTGTYTPGTQTPSPTKAPAPKYPQTGDLPATWPAAPGVEPALVLGFHPLSRCPQPLLKEGTMTAAPLAIQKINPCLMELCRFFQKCLCTGQGRPTRTEAMRYCLEHYSWFLKNATFICQRVTRVSHSHTLKQKCLENVCKSV
ncbi:PREDICTED: HERV-H LTR-associating protein 1 [Elephantulus edwardii]|uniref:HERV-H LTR-associating protein 1 n=1 Tax=Elephantulus edwardii TaxID=28737 RepID=UPI0003F0E89C|nr:PREDICTED: HERV-H LTR-associating protein 1 [Elephantulus edwardii]